SRAQFAAAGRSADLSPAGSIDDRRSTDHCVLFKRARRLGFPRFATAEFFRVQQRVARKRAVSHCSRLLGRDSLLLSTEFVRGYGLGRASETLSHKFPLSRKNLT